MHLPVSFINLYKLVFVLPKKYPLIYNNKLKIIMI